MAWGMLATFTFDVQAFLKVSALQRFRREPMPQV